LLSGTLIRTLPLHFPHTVKNLIIKTLGTGFGLGYSKLMPGTLGSLWGVLIFYFVRDQPRLHLGIIAVVVTVIAIYISHEAEKVFGEKDCQKIVIDEVAGQVLAYLLVPYSLTNLILGFVFFRFFDMTKIFPADVVQKHLPGGFGVVLDDTVAGIQAAVLLYFAPLFWIGF